MKPYNMVCDHEPHCSKPGTYCRIGEFTELVDGAGNITAIIMPDDAPKDCQYVCTECGVEAHLSIPSPVPASKTMGMFEA